MTYNVENLFDAIHDKGKNDWAHLPLTEKQRNPKIQSNCNKIKNSYYRSECLFLDWSEAVITSKITNLGKVISSYNNGLGPDILVLQEIENLRILQQLNFKGLRNMGYIETILLEGPDKRGIDVAILSRYKLAGPPQIHQVNLSKTQKNARPTRPILEASFKIGHKTLSIFANHWPSQSNSDQTRWIAAKTLITAAQNKAHPVIAAGDFNTLDDDSPNGIYDIATNPKKTYFFYDAKRWNQPSAHTPNGTHWYRGHWSFLDKILVSANHVHQDIHPVSFSVYAPKFAFTERQWYRIKNDPSTEETHKVPKRFDSKTGQGYSDHLPAVFKFEI